MPDLYYNLNQHKSIKTHRKRRRLLFAGLALLFLLMAGAAVYFWQQSANGAGKVVVVKPLTRSYYYGSPERVIKNDVFSFRSSADWQFSPEESSPNKYVFFTQQNNLIVYELDVIFNKSLDGTAVNYVLPVTLSDKGMDAANVSGRCGDTANQNTNTLPPVYLNMQFQGANYICSVRGSGEKAAAALVGGSYDISLKNSHGQSQVLNFAFVNNSSSYFGQVFQDILQSFKLN